MAGKTDIYILSEGEVAGPYDEETVTRMMGTGEIQRYDSYAKVPPHVTPRRRDYHPVSISEMWKERHRHGEEAHARAREQRLKMEAIVLTTEAAPDLKISKRLGILSAECAYGMSLLKDFFTAMTDLAGGRSATTQNTLREAKETVLLELRRQALQIGADAVVAVSLNYSEFSGGGKSMLFCIATGTAVTIDETKGLIESS